MKVRRGVLVSIALFMAVAWEVADAAPPANGDQPWGPPQGATAAPASGAREHWDEHFQGRGNVTETRCLGMNRGPDCITAAKRKEAARRAAAIRAAAGADLVPSSRETHGGGKRR